MLVPDRTLAHSRATQMKILFISNLYPPIYVGGYEQICFDTAEQLKMRGHEVHVLTSTFRSQEVSHKEESVYRLLRLREHWDPPKPHSSPLDMLDSVQVQIRNVGVARRIVKTVRPDTVLFWNGLHLGHGILSAMEELSPVAYYLSDTWLSGVLIDQQRAQQLSLTRRLYHHMLGVLGVPSDKVSNRHLLFSSRALQTQYEQMGADVSPGKVVHHGIVTDNFPFQEPHILRVARGEPHRVLFVGQVVPHKGVRTLIEAIGKVRNQHGLGSTKLTLVGRIQSESFLMQLNTRIRELGMSEDVEFAGLRPRTELTSIFADHDVFAFTTEQVEPFGIALLEAMSAGIPVVTTTLGGPAEIVDDGENALAFRAGDADDLASKLTWMLTHRDKAARLGVAASRHVRQGFTLEAQVSAIENYLKSIAPSKA